MKWWSAAGLALTAAFFVYGMLPSSPKRDYALEPRAIYPTPKAITGFARVIDGDTIIVSGFHVRLWGIDTPAAFVNDREHGPATVALEKRGLSTVGIVKAGLRSREKMIELTRDTQLDCVTIGTSYDRLVSRCFYRDDPKAELSCEMLKTGLAVEWKEYSRGALRHCVSH